MDELIQYAGAMTLGTLSVPLALGLSWLALRCIFDLMPAANGAPVRAQVSARPRPFGSASLVQTRDRQGERDWHALFGGHGAHLPARR